MTLQSNNPKAGLESENSPEMGGKKPRGTEGQLWILNGLSHINPITVYKEPIEPRIGEIVIHVINYSKYQSILEENAKLKYKLGEALAGNMLECSDHFETRKKLQQTQILLSESYEYISELSPSWLPENPRMERHKILNKLQASLILNQKGETMQAYMNGITKEQFVNETKKHRELDQFVKGTYNSKSGACAVGCALRSVNKIKGLDLNTSIHAEYETHLGIPEWLAKLSAKIKRRQRKNC